MRDEIACPRFLGQSTAHSGTQVRIAADVVHRSGRGEAVCPQGDVDEVVGVFLDSRFACVHVGRQETFGEFVALLEALAFDAHQFAFHEQLLQRPLGRLPVPPAAAPFVGILEVAGEQRTLGADPIQHVCPHTRILAVLPPAPLAPGHAAHHRQHEAIVPHRQIGCRVGPVLERPS